MCVFVSSIFRQKSLKRKILRFRDVGKDIVKRQILNKLIERVLLTN